MEKGAEINENLEYIDKKKSKKKKGGITENEGREGKKKIQRKRKIQKKKLGNEKKWKMKLK